MLKFLSGTLTGVLATLLVLAGVGIYAQTPSGQKMKCRAMLTAEVEQRMQDPLMKATIEEELAAKGKTLDELVAEGCEILVQRGERF